jgi:AcrR family transcriptional regulator
MNTSENRNRTRERLEQREADILQAATGLFAANGFHNTSTRKIASAAGVSEGTVFHYFNTKNALLLAILDVFYEGLIETAGECVQQTMDTRERLLLLARNHLRALMENQAIMMRLIQVYLSVDVNYYLDYKNSHIHQLNYRYTRIFDNVIKEGIQRGYLDEDLELSALRDLFFGGLEYGMRTLLGRKNTRELDRYVEKIIEPLWSSMTVHDVEPSVTAMAPDQRLEAACQRVERAASLLEKASRKP